jgi:hypothetical protein
VTRFPSLVNARDDEHLVVHRKPEHDRKREHGDERIDRPFLNAEEAAQPAALEDELDYAERCADREQIHHSGLEGNDERSEDDQQQDSAVVLAEAGDDEERLIDADSEPDHQRELRGEVGHLDDAAGQRDQPHPGAEPEQRGGNREPIAANEPKLISRITTAAPTPTMVANPSEACCACSIAWPPSSTWRRDDRAAWAVVMTRAGPDRAA